MYEEKIRKINIDWKSLIIKMVILLVVLFVVLWIIAIVRKDNKPKVESNLIANLKTMQTTANEYFTGSRLPEVINGRKKLTLQEMFDTKLLVEFKDQNNNSCDTKESYIEATKISSKEYTIKTKLVCGGESEVAVNTVTIKQDDILVDNDKDNNLNNPDDLNPDDNTTLPNDDENNNDNSNNDNNSNNNVGNNNNNGNNNQSGGSSFSKPNNSSTTQVITKVPVSEVRINYKKIYLYPGESKTVTAVVYPLNANDKNVIWSSSNNNVATVVRGKVTGVSVGSILITASVGGKSTTMEVEVINKNNNSSGNINNGNNNNNNGSNNGNSNNSSSNFNTMIVNEYRRLQDEAASLAKKTNTSLYVENSYSGGNIAVFNIVQRYGYANKTIYSYEMDSNGNRKVILDNRSSLNKATLTSNTNTSAKYLNVYVNSITMDSTEKKAISYSSNDIVYFRSSDPNIVTVDNEGVLTPVYVGVATVTVSTSTGLSKNVKVQVTNPKTTGYLNVTQTNITLTSTDTKAINYSSNEKVYFKSNDTNIVTVSSNGVITPKGVGTTTIKVYTVSGLTKEIMVKVTNPKTDSAGTFLYLGTTNVVLAPNDNYVLGYTSNGKVKFKSSNSSVASVSSDGTIIANRNGSAVITVTADGILSRSVYVIVR